MKYTICPHRGTHHFKRFYMATSAYCNIKQNDRTKQQQQHIYKYIQLLNYERAAYVCAN